MRELTLGFGAIALAVAGILLAAQKSEHAGRFAMAGLLLIIAGILIPLSPAPFGGPGLNFESSLLWLAAWAVALRIVGVRWATWFAVPAVIGFVVWPNFHQFLPLIPWWAWIDLGPLLVFLTLVIIVRLARAMATSVAGDDQASRTVSGWFGALVGGWGRARPQPLKPPELPRPRVVPFELPGSGEQ